MRITDGLAKHLYGMTQAEAADKGICIRCKQPVKDMKLEPIDLREWYQSRLCPACWSNILGEEQ